MVLITNKKIWFVFVLVVLAASSSFFSSFNIANIIYYSIFTREVLPWEEVLCAQDYQQPDLMKDNAVPLKMLFRNTTSGSNNSIFLIETSCIPYPKYRVWCSVESWARNNPHQQVVFVITSGRLEGGHELTSLLQHQYSNLNLGTVDVFDLFQDTPLLTFFNSRQWAKDNTWPVNQLSNMVRLLVLWWWGGVYVDTDTISLQTLNVPPNSLTFESSYLINNAFLSFQARHPMLLKLMEDMEQHYKPGVWGTLGPEVVSRVMETVCGKSIDEMVVEAPVTCLDNTTILPINAISPVPWEKAHIYFQPGGGNHFDKTYEESIALHFWNKMSKNMKIEVNSNSVYEVAAKRFCPITYQTATKYSNVF